MNSKELIVSVGKCTGCEACAQICPKSAISMAEDTEAFRYPSVDEDLCIGCGLCKKTCPIENMPERYTENKLAFGGYIKDYAIREESTSGGAFSAIAEAWCDENYVIFGAETVGLEVYHSFITDKRDLSKFRKSKYTQSRIGQSYKQAKAFLNEGRKVLFSGTPCQIAGLRSFLGRTDTSRLLTIEVICEGVPSPHYIRRFSEHIKRKHGSPISSIDYRFKDRNKWDYQVMAIDIESESGTKKTYKRDRWFNPFWSVWLQHLMSRPSCYECRFTNSSRVADITLGDLWGVHIYCPELYGANRGTSLVICNTDMGKRVMEIVRPLMYGHDIPFEQALKYQGPMRKPISMNEKRQEFMSDVVSMDYGSLNRKWAHRSSRKLLFQKYVFGSNAQKVWWFNFKKKLGL